MSALIDLMISERVRIIYIMRITLHSRALWDHSSSLALVQWLTHPIVASSVTKPVDSDDAVAILKNLFQEVEPSLTYLNHELSSCSIAGGPQVAEQLQRENASIDESLQRLENDHEHMKIFVQEVADSTEATSRQLEDRLTGKVKPQEVVLRSRPSLELRPKSAVDSAKRVSYIENTPPVGSNAIDVVSRGKPVLFDQEFKRKKSKRYRLSQCVKKQLSVFGV
ncbi:MAG: uncharacterized protein KVP18_001503 [Porospora cf. gigantea A]|uniref:uncharacterized protein n=1 Tax=Porospora cf. gigantea A TaxID=2853593 RepID=UPI00355ACB3F|nr:MAG: hypothetical protein KVP18_001503 [Porospora cf. gigantea A]